MKIPSISFLHCNFSTHFANASTSLQSLVSFFEKNVAATTVYKKASTTLPTLTWKKAGALGLTASAFFVIAYFYFRQKPKDIPPPNTLVKVENEDLRKTVIALLQNNYVLNAQTLERNTQQAAQERDALIANTHFLQLVIERARLNNGDLEDNISNYLYGIVANPFSKFTQVCTIQNHQVFIASEVQAANLAELNNKGITLVVNVPGYSPSRSADEVSYSFFKNSGNNISYIEGNVADLEGQIPEFKKIVSEITDYLTNNQGNVLIHCKEGKSRSAAIAIALLLHQNPTWTFEKVVKDFAHKRGITIPKETKFLPRTDLLQALKDTYRPGEIWMP